MNRKGQFPEEIGWTLIVLLVVVIFSVTFLIYSLLIVRFPGIGKGPISESIEFIHMSNRPNIVAETLSSYLIDDRQVLEHAIESAHAGSLANASSDIEKGVEYYMNYYDYVSYYINIRNTDGNEIMSASNKLTTCGENNDGFCSSPVLKYLNSDPLGAICGKGRIKIDDVDNACKNLITGKYCCKDNKDSTGHYLDQNNNPLPSCGDDTRYDGVCDYPDKGRVFVHTINFPFFMIVTIDLCREGRLTLNDRDNVCSSGMLCCASVSSGSEKFYDVKTEVPLLYKGGKLGWLEVIVGV